MKAMKQRRRKRGTVKVVEWDLRRKRFVFKRIPKEEWLRQGGPI